MRFSQFFLLAPALLAAAQQTTTDSDSSSASAASASSTSSSSSVSSTSSSASMSMSSSSGAEESGSDNMITTTFGGGQATLVTNAEGQVVGTITDGLRQIAESLNPKGGEDVELGTLMTSVPLTTITTTAEAGAVETGSGNAAPVATAGVLGGLLGAGLVVVGMM